MNQSQAAILLSTFQGEKFLREQLNSFEDQTYSAWQVWASHDGSSDNTLEIIQVRNSFFKRVQCFHKAQIYRRTSLGQAGLWFGIFLNKI